MKTNYNFLGSGDPIRSRGIFSGLSNETMGAASCFAFPYTPPMDAATQQLLQIFNTYQAVLFQYASLRTRNKFVAALIVDEVAALRLEQIRIIPPGEVRNFLFTCTRDCCDQWLQAKGPTLYQRKPKNPT